MALCKRCALNGTRRNGGELGICRTHAKTKCQICGAPSLGAQLCMSHAHQEELMRWKRRAQLESFDMEHEFDLLEIRKEKLQEAKFLAHQSVETFFRAMHQATQAIWGTPAVPAERDPGRKAA